MNLKKHTPIITLCLLVILLVAIIYSKAFFSPNSYLFSDSGDGMKNYYTYAYYVNNNSFSMEFEGMNYPYSENMMYTDCHPFQAFFLKIIVTIFPALGAYSIGMLNTLLLTSFLLSAIVLFYIFRRLKINNLLAILGSIAIVALSPQIFRITGHLALSYSFAIPLIILLLLRYEQDNKPKLNLLFIGFSCVIFLYTHAYLGLMTCGVVVMYAILKLFTSWRNKTGIDKKKSILLLLSGVIPILLFFIVTKITDSHTGRTNNPWGIAENHADWDTVFLPTFNTSEKLPGIAFPEIQQTWEGWAYIGLPAIIAVLFYLIASIKHSFSIKRIELNKTLLPNGPLRILFLVSIVFLLLSMYIPFRWGLDFLVDYLKVLKQFRALGRFAWIFYFTTSIMLIYMVNQFSLYLVSKNKRVLAYAIIALVPLVMIYESKDYHIHIRNEISKAPNKFDINQNDVVFQKAIEKLDANNYQAILPLPFYYIGSDNFGKPSLSEEIQKLSFLYSYHLALPMISAYLTRTSIWESKNIMQLFSSNFYKKEIQQDFKNSKPLLVICMPDLLSDYERQLIKDCKILEQNDAYILLELPISKLFESNSEKIMTNYNSKKNQFIEKDNFLMSDTSSAYFFDDFNLYQNEISRTGKTGSKDLPQNNFTVIFSTEQLTLDLDSTYNVSFWIYHGDDNFGQDQVNGIAFIQEVQGEEVTWINVKNMQECTEIDNNWSLIELEFTHSNASSHYELVLKGADVSKKNYIIDDLLFYQKGVEITKEIKDENILFWNNNRIPLSTN